MPQPKRARASDITYVRTCEGWLYLAVVIDLFSRRVVGWSIQPRRTHQGYRVAGRTPAKALYDLIAEQWLLPPISAPDQEVTLSS